LVGPAKFVELDEGEDDAEEEVEFVVGCLVSGFLLNMGLNALVIFDLADFATEKG
jgi:hypothetical protein